jgi:uncharacterized protein YndB with AHSA1/START domain
MTTMTETTTQVYRVYIRSSAQQIWDAIVDPEWSERYGYGGRMDYDLRPGGEFKATASEAMLAGGAPETIIDGEVLEADPPRRLVQTWRMLMDDALAAEGFTRLTYEIDEIEGGYCKLTVVHDLAGAPGLAHVVGGGIEDQGGGGGWAWILSDLKSLLETGSGFIPRG